MGKTTGTSHLLGWQKLEILMRANADEDVARWEQRKSNARPL